MMNVEKILIPAVLERHGVVQSSNRLVDARSLIALEEGLQRTCLGFAMLRKDFDKNPDVNNSMTWESDLELLLGCSKDRGQC